MLAANLLLVLTWPQPPNFKVTHHVVLRERILTSFDVHRDGSLVGSTGDLGLHDGNEDPLIILRGKVIPFKNQTGLSFCRVKSFTKNGYEVEDDEFNLMPAMVRKGSLILTGKGRRESYPADHEWTKAMPTTKLRSLFPVPRNMRDAASMEAVYWKEIGGGYQFAVTQSSAHMEYGYRTAMTFPNGSICPLEDCISGLAGYEVRGIAHVSAHWFVLSANKKHHDNSDTFDVGFGNELFWVEMSRR